MLNCSKNCKIWEELYDSFLFGEIGSFPSQTTMAEGEEFGQRRPPLSVTIKQILERYPDGQIFKVNYV